MKRLKAVVKVTDIVKTTDKVNVLWCYTVHLQI